MLTRFFFPIIRFLGTPFGIAVILALFLAFWYFKGGNLTKGTTVLAQAEASLRELAAIDPQAAAIIQRIGEQHDRTALLLGVHGTQADQRYRSILADMATEVVTVKNMPYRVRLAGLGLEKMDLRGEEHRRAFFTSYGVVLDGLALADDWEGINAFMTLLEQASREPGVWPLIKDDPLALIIWSQVQDPALVEFYHRNRDWLADPLAVPELMEMTDGWELEAALRGYARHERILRQAVVDGELGVFALALMWSHGTLVATAVERFNLDPAEVMSVIYMNPDLFGQMERDVTWIGEQAAWMAVIARQHPVVWFSAGMTPFALQLHRDAPHVSGDILERYGADDIGVLIYALFAGADQVNAAATAVARFGDVAIYVFSRYADPEFSEQLGKFLVDRDIGIRAVPFIVQFGDVAFNRLQEDKRWAARYFERDGSPRKDNLDWVQQIPGGAPFVVVGNWVKGYPSEWSEIGWAAVDVVTLPLVVKSFGASRAITSAARSRATVVHAARQGSRGVPALTRSQNLETWSRSLQAYRRGAATGGVQMTRLREAARLAAATGIRVREGAGVVGKAASRVAQRISISGKNALNAWRAVDPRVQLWLYRGMLAMVMYINVTDRIVPNMDKIGSGIGDVVGQAASGLVVMSGEALSSSLSRFFDELTGGNQAVRGIAYWGVALSLAVGVIFFFSKGLRERGGYIVVRQ